MHINTDIIKKISFILAISLANFWIYQLIQINLFLSLILIIESILLFLSIFLRLKILTALTFILLLILCTHLIISHFDKNIFSISDIDLQKIGKRHEYYAKELGKIYKNRIGIFYFNNLGLSISKIINNLFSNLDFYFYFPSKYPILWSPLFIVGLLYLLVNVDKIPTIFFLIALLISSLVSFEDKYGAILLFPFINLCISIGLVKLLSILKRKVSFI